MVNKKTGRCQSNGGNIGLGQTTLLPDSLEDYGTEDNPVRVVGVFIDELDLEALGVSFRVLCRGRPVGLLIIPRRC